ncbi:DNA ligase 1-like isoform X2 [Aphidius gifuensis]|uniref:DNA ligase 1-like isoform X2 n=1 Tax=Aphidius gifuensis TaxID=684658 RepID=UPI001CDB52C1|nr:DNA ligase 1-like isoform X2 [Aphidius gifuensis]
MAQRSITSFFKKIEPSENKDNNTSSSKAKVSDVVDDAVEGKRKRDNKTDNSPSSPPTKKNNIVKKTKSTVKKLDSNKKKPKPETSIIKNLNKSKFFEDKKDEVVVKKSTKKRARIIEPSSSDEETQVTPEKDEATDESTSNNGKLTISSDSESDCEEKSNKKEKSLSPAKKTTADSEESSPDDDKKNTEKEDNNDKLSPTKKSKKNSVKNDDKKSSPSSSKKPVKNMSSFFGKKQDKTEKSNKKEKSLSPDKKTTAKSEEPSTNDDEKNTEKEDDNDKSSPKKNSVKDEEKKSSPTSSKKPAKNMSAFFGKKQDKTEAQQEIKYDPSAKKYHPIDDACWKKNEKVPYIALTKTFELIEDTSSRLKMIDILANYYRSVIVLSPDDLLPSIYLCLNSLAPSYEGIELGLADTTLMKAIAQCTGRTMSQIKSDIHKIGDIGSVAENSRSNQRIMVQPSPLMVSHVFTKLREIANLSGSSSVEKKVNKIQSLFVACRESEAKFLIRSLAGKLRIGLAEQSVLSALSMACTLTPPNQSNYPPEIIDASKNLTADKFKEKYDKISLIIKTTYCECPNYNLIIPVIFNDGVYELPNKCKLRPGVPLKPMLAHPTKGVQEVLKRFDGLKFTCEWKYDGERAQIHVDDDGNITIYSRNQENNTSKYPDIIKRLTNILNRDKIKSCILDCESVAWDNDKKQILPFQILSTRKRKNANESDIKVQVCVFMFDLLYLNGESLVQEPFSKRRDLLKNHFEEIEGEWKFATCLDTTKIEEVQEFLEESIKGNCEGLMIKTLDEDATYEIAKRSRNWLKLKKDYLEGIGDTIDVVVIGGYIGKGKRTGTYGGFLLACYDSTNEEYQSICKIGTGFSEDDLTKHTEFLKDHIVKTGKSYYRVDSSLEPDHWFEPVQVWEIKCADLSLSPVHTAAVGIVDSSKGISLRFPRFIKIRDDKNPEDATSAQQIADMYNNQEQIINQQANNSANVDEDDY